MQITPTPLITQPISALGPSGARLTGSMKMPEPMIVPTTIALVIHRPIVCGLLVSVAIRFPPALGNVPPQRLVRAAKHRPNRKHDARIPFSGAGQPGGRHGRRAGEASRAARDVFEEVDEALGQNLFRLMREGPDDELRLTENAQPAIMANSMAVFAALTSEGGVDLAKAAQFVAGHSLGEYSALVRGGVVRPGDDGEAAQAARPGDAGGGAGRAWARWRRCSARTSSWRRRSPTPRRRAKCAPSPTTMTRARS